MKKILTVLVVLFVTNLFAQDTALKFATAPNNPNTKEGIQVFLGFLAEKTHKKFEAVTLDFEEMLPKLAAGEIAFADLTSSAYATAINVYGNKIKYVATVEARNEKGKLIPSYKGIFFALKTSPYKSMLDLKGKSFAFVSKTSTSGYIYPLATLNSMGINPETFFSSLTFAGDHAKIFDGIKNGFLDAGVSNYDSLEKAKAAYGDIFKVIGETVEIPSGAIVASSTVDPDTVSNIADALVNIKSTDPVVNYPGFLYKGFAKKESSFYDFIKKMLRQSAEMPAHPYP